MCAFCACPDIPTLHPWVVSKGSWGSVGLCPFLAAWAVPSTLPVPSLQLLVPACLYIQGTPPMCRIQHLFVSGKPQKAWREWEREWGPQKLCVCVCAYVCVLWLTEKWIQILVQTQKCTRSSSGWCCVTPLHWQCSPGCPRTSPRLFGFPCLPSQNNTVPVWSVRRDLHSREEQPWWHICAGPGLWEVLWKSWQGGSQWGCGGWGSEPAWPGQLLVVVSSGRCFLPVTPEWLGLWLFTPLNADFLVRGIVWDEGAGQLLLFGSTETFPLMFGAWVQACRGETIFL